MQGTRRRAADGQSLAEFALFVPVLALLLAGTIDLARIFYINVTLANAANVAATFALDDKAYLRYTQMNEGTFQAIDMDGDGNNGNNPNPCAVGDSDDICGKKRATLLARYAAVKEARSIGLTLSDVAINPDASFNSSQLSWTPNTKFTVTVRTTFRPITPIVSGMFGGADPVMRQSVQLRHNCVGNSACSW